MGDQLYLRPAAFIWGAAASQAIIGQHAIPIAGGPAACTLFEVIEGTPQSNSRRFVTAQDLLASDETAFAETVSRIGASRTPIVGLSMDRPRIMGVVNVTPDSFSDGGEFNVTDRSTAHIAHLVDAGADLIDIGGESTRPGAAPVDDAEELRRVMPVIRSARQFGCPISIDTRKSAVMTAATQAGAAIINDVSALTYDEHALSATAASNAPVILMHAQGDPRSMQDAPSYDDVLLEVYDYLEARIEAAVGAGIARDKIIVDPGIGFGKTLEHNLALLSGLGLLHGLGVTVLLGVSRKRLIGALTGESDPKKRSAGSIGLALAGAAQGVQIFRVHDVRDTVHALTCWRAAVTK
ncbi:MAG: dihydropteroate synthase [Hyphomicrobiales bacterium]|nr:dihydropteroate synthase [Hyphomicrobiales bacterium]